MIQSWIPSKLTYSLILKNCFKLKKKITDYLLCDNRSSQHSKAKSSFRLGFFITGFKQAYLENGFLNPITFANFKLLPYPSLVYLKDRIYCTSCYPLIKTKSKFPLLTQLKVSCPLHICLFIIKPFCQMSNKNIYYHQSFHRTITSACCLTAS